MKKTFLVKQGTSFGDEALRILRACSLFDVRLRGEREPREQSADLVLFDGDEDISLLVVCKSQVGPEAARQIVRRSPQGKPEEPLLVLSRLITPAAQDVLREAAINYIDEAGSVFLETPHALVSVRAPVSTDPSVGKHPARLRGKAGILGQLLLLEPKESWRIDEASSRAGVSLGLAHKVFTSLEDAGILATVGAGPSRRRVLRDGPALLDRLVVDDGRAFEGRPTGAFLLARSGLEVASKVSRALSEAEIDHAVTGAVAADVMSPMLTSVPVAQIRVTTSVPVASILATVGCRPVDDGANVLFVQERDDAGLAFRHEEQSMWLANMVRVYLDVLRDPRRGQEQAEMIRNRMFAD